jgi:hypothetical protein
LSSADLCEKGGQGVSSEGERAREYRRWNVLGLGRYTPVNVASTTNVKEATSVGAVSTTKNAKTVVASL